MRRLFFGLIVIMVLSVPLLLLQAGNSVDDRGNPNDPAVNERANACYAGAALEGKCHTEDEWIAGWYLIRFQYGIYTRSDVPEEYRWVLPTDTNPVDDLQPAATEQLPL